MASIKIIRRRIKSAQNIAQITKAMEMVAASKMKKAQEAAALGKAYADKIYEATRELASRTEKQINPLLSAGNPKGKALVILISTTKGLCGGLNTNLFREVNNWFDRSSGADFISVGKKGESFVIKSGRKLAADFSDKSSFVDSVAPITNLLVSGFLDGKYKEISVAYNSFVNALKQLPQKKQILPLSVFDNTGNENEKKEFNEFVIEPNEEDVLNSLIPHYLENQLRSAIYEAQASEQSARMIAMKNATDAALDLMDSLTLSLNKIRQEKITYEIADTVTARMALE